MTEQREPPLLSRKEIEGHIGNPSFVGSHGNTWTYIQQADVDDLLEAQREADIKWMKKNCYLKAERELPENPYGKGKSVTYVMPEKHYAIFSTPKNENYLEYGFDVAIDMLKEVKGVSFRACEEFKDV